MLHSEQRDRLARQTLLGGSVASFFCTARAVARTDARPAPGVTPSRNRTADVVDAIAIATAVQHQAPVATSDPGDLAHIAGSTGVKMRLLGT